MQVGQTLPFLLSPSSWRLLGAGVAELACLELQLRQPLRLRWPATHPHTRRGHGLCSGRGYSRAAQPDQMNANGMVTHQKIMGGCLSLSLLQRMNKLCQWHIGNS